MTENYVQVPPNSSGLKYRTIERTVGANVVEIECVTMVDSGSGNTLTPARTEQFPSALTAAGNLKIALTETGSSSISIITGSVLQINSGSTAFQIVSGSTSFSIVSGSTFIPINSGSTSIPIVTGSSTLQVYDNTGSVFYVGLTNPSLGTALTLTGSFVAPNAAGVLLFASGSGQKVYVYQSEYTYSTGQFACFYFGNTTALTTTRWQINTGSASLFRNAQNYVYPLTSASSQGMYLYTSGSSNPVGVSVAYILT